MDTQRMPPNAETEPSAPQPVIVETYRGPLSVPIAHQQPEQRRALWLGEPERATYERSAWVRFLSDHPRIEHLFTRLYSATRVLHTDDLPLAMAWFSIFLPLITIGLFVVAAALGSIIGLRSNSLPAFVQGVLWFISCVALIYLPFAIIAGIILGGKAISDHRHSHHPTRTLWLAILGLILSVTLAVGGSIWAYTALASVRR